MKSERTTSNLSESVHQQPNIYGLSAKTAKRKLVFSRVLLIALCLALAPTAFASTTWYVDGMNGNDSNNCTSSTTACKTIGHAISRALSGDTIMVAAATYKENLSIGINLTIIGSGATTTIIDAGGAETVVTIYKTANVTLSGLTIQKGHGYGSGGGILNFGKLKIIASTVRGNNVTVPPNCKFLCGALGGGISNGGITIAGTLTINNSTISGNAAASVGGGLDGTATLQNSIVANNSGGNCSGTMTSHGYNLSSDTTCKFTGPGDMNSINPLLGPLQNNGGPTQTTALLPGSPAIDAGNPSGCTDGLGHLLKTDQRGLPRPDKEDAVGCDMGAYESQSVK